MHTSIESVENGAKMSTIKKINDGILQLFKRVKMRSLGAILLGGCAGLSLTASVLPTVFSSLGHSDSFSIRWVLAGYATYAMMAWGVGGWAARRIGNPAAAAIIMGVLGLVSGLLLTYAEIDRSLTMLLAGGGAAMLYGGIGGLLIATTLAGEKQADDDGKPAPRPPAQKKDSVRLFRFFK